MGTIQTDQPNDHRDSIDLASAPLPGQVAAPVRRALGISRIGYAVGALVVIAGAAAILFTGALSPSAPATAVKVEPANTVALSPMSNSMGFWDFVSYPKPALSPMENDTRYWDPNWVPLQPSAPTVQCATKYSCREGIPAQSPNSASTLQCPTVLVTCRSSNGAQVPAPSSTLPVMSNDMGYWDRIQPPTQPNYWDRGQPPTQPARKSSTNVLYGDAAIYRTSAP